MLEAAIKINSKLGQADAHWGLAYCYFEGGDTRSSLESANEIVRLASDLDLTSNGQVNQLLCQGLYRQGRALVWLGEFEEAIAIGEMALELFTRADKPDLSSEVNILHLLGLANMFLGRIDLAQKFEKQSVEISRKTGDLRAVGNSHNSLGFQSYIQGNGDQAIQYYEEALDIAREVGNKAARS